MDMIATTFDIAMFPSRVQRAYEHRMVRHQVDLWKHFQVSLYEFEDSTRRLLQALQIHAPDLNGHGLDLQRADDLRIVQRTGYIDLPPAAPGVRRASRCRLRVARATKSHTLGAIPDQVLGVPQHR